jgi:hypothetical protein
MSERDYNACRMEAVAVFHDATSFQAAIDDLLSAGFDGVDINALAHEDTITAKLGRPYSSTKEFMDDPDAPRIGYVPAETIGDAEGAVIGAGIYIPAIVGSLAVVASGGTLLGAIAAAAIAGGAGGLVGAALARFIGHEHARHLDQHLQHGGLLLWVRARDPEHAEKALEILQRHATDDVHLHDIPERAGKARDVPQERHRILHILERPPEPGAPTAGA